MPTRLVSLQIIAYIQALGIYSLSYTMSLKPPAAKASVFKRNFVVDVVSSDVVSSVVTEPDFTKDGFYNDFSKMLGYFYGDIVGFEGSCVLRSDQPCRKRVIKGDEFNRMRRPGVSRSCAKAAGENGASVADEPPTLRVPKLAPAILRPTVTRSPCRARHLLSQAAAAVKNKASMSLSKALCPRFEYSIAQNKQF